jgi:DNA-directed RNA polymerase subunit L
MNFLGYKMPHPLENKIEVKVQTNGARPTQVFMKAIDGILDEINITSSEFDKQLKDHLNKKMQNL